MKREELEKEAEAFVSEKADKGNFDVEKFGKAYFSESSMKQALVKFAEPREKRIAELEAQIEKMKWHKIADGDIPEVTGDYITNIGVLTWDYYGDGRYGWHTVFCEFCDCCDDIDSDEVIAWCEIPKYTKEIKEK